MKIRCLQCQTQYNNIPDSFFKRKVVCKNCQFRFIAEDYDRLELAQETRLAEIHTDSEDSSKHFDFPQQTRLAEKAEIPLETEQPQVLSTLSRILDAGSEHLSHYQQIHRQSVYNWKSGDVILDLYEVKSLLGEGQFGKVYQVRHRNWNLDLALKTPKPKALSAGAENIIKEAETWVNLPLHPNIVNCYYVRQINGVPQIFSEYVDGGDLKQLIQSKALYQGNQQMILKRILDIAIQSAWGLLFAHEQGLIHQDVKPANIMLGSDGMVRITDFGLAKVSALSELSENAEDKGIVAMGLTPAYASPEQLAGKTLSLSTDIWSWAVCVLEMIVGYCSWEAGAAAPGILEACLEQELEEPSALHCIPVQLAKLLSRCFEEQLSLRPVSMLQIAQDLIALYEQQNAQQYPRQIPQQGSETASSYNNQAISLLDLGRIGEAVTLWQKALSIDPQHFESIYNQSLLQWQQEGLEETVLLEKILSWRDKVSSQSHYLNSLSRLYLQFGHYDEVIKLLNKGRLKFSQLISQSDKEYDSDNSIELALALCARYRRVKNPHRWQFIAHSLQESINSKTIDPYTITAYSLALQRSGKKQKAVEFYNMIQASGILPVSFKQAVNLFLPDYEVLYQLAVKNCYKLNFIDHDEQIIFSRGNEIILWCLSSNKLVQRLTGHTSKITALECIPELGLIVTGSQQGNIRVWDYKNGCQLHVWFAHKAQINALSVSPCGQFLATASAEKILCLWHLKDASQVLSFYGEGHDADIYEIQFSPDGKQIVSASEDKIIRVWSVENGRTLHILREHEQAVKNVIWLNNQQIVSASDDKTIRLWDLESTKITKSIKSIKSTKVFNGHKGNINCLTATKDKAYIISGASDGNVYLWNMATGKGFSLHRFGQAIIDLELNSSEQFVLISTRKGLAILEIDNPFRYQAAFQFSRPESAIQVDKAQRQYQQLIYKAEAELSQYHYLSAMQSLQLARNIPAYEQDNKAFKLWTSLYLKVPRIKLKNIWKLLQVKNNSLRINSLCTALNSNNLFTSSQSGTICQWPADSFKSIKLFNEKKPVTRIKLTQNDASLLFSSENDIRLIDIKSGDLFLSFNQHDADISCFELTPDGRFVISADGQGGCYLWRLLTGELNYDYSNDHYIVSTLAISPNAQLFVCGHINNNRITVRDLQQGKIITELDEHEKAVSSLAISSDGRFILSGSVDASLRLWQLNSSHKKSLRVFRGHSKRIYQLAMDPQNKIAASVSEDRSLKIWNLNTADCLFTFNIVDADFTSVSISMDGQYIYAGLSDGNILVYCLDWELDSKLYSGWQEAADIYLHNYLLSHKVNNSEQELIPVIRLLECSGLGYLEHEEIAKQLLKKIENIHQQKILSGSIRGHGGALNGQEIKNHNKRRSKQKTNRIWLLSASFFVMFMLFIWFSSDNKINRQENEILFQETNNISEKEQLTIDKMLDIGFGLSRINRNIVIVNNKLNINSINAPENIKLLKLWLQLDEQDLKDGWGQSFKYVGIKSGAFKGRIILRSAGQDGQYKTDDDLLLNGFPYRDSLVIKKNNRLVTRLSDIKIMKPSSIDEDEVTESLIDPETDNQIKDDIVNKVIDESLPLNTEEAIEVTIKPEIIVETRD